MKISPFDGFFPILSWAGGMLSGRWTRPFPCPSPWAFSQSHDIDRWQRRPDKKQCCVLMVKRVIALMGKPFFLDLHRDLP